MAQYKIYNGENWIDAAVQGKIGPIGPYYKPVLDDESNLFMIPETVTNKLEELSLGNIKGDIGRTGYGFNTNLFDNWDFTHAVKRGSGNSNYICERWYRDSSNTEFSISNSGLLIKKISSNSYIKQNFPYISPGKYIISIVSDAQIKSSFDFQIVSAGGSDIYIANTQNPIEFYQTENLIRYIHYGIVEIPEELISNGTNYPSIQIIPKEANKIIYRAKFEVNEYRGEESNSSTIAQDIFQNSSYNNFIVASSDENGVYTSPFLSNTIVIEKEAWVEGSEAFFYATIVSTNVFGRCHIIATAELDSIEDFADNEIICSDHNEINGTLTFRASSMPDKAVKANILVIKY